MAEHPEEVPARSDDVDLGWWQRPDGYRNRISWNKDTQAVYMLDPSFPRDDPKNEVVLGTAPSAGHVRKQLAGLDPHRPEDFSEAMYRLRGHR